MESNKPTINENNVTKGGHGIIRLPSLNITKEDLSPIFNATGITVPQNARNNKNIRLCILMETPFGSNSMTMGALACFMKTTPKKYVKLSTPKELEDFVTTYYEEIEGLSIGKRYILYSELKKTDLYTTLQDPEWTPAVQRSLLKLESLHALHVSCQVDDNVLSMLEDNLPHVNRIENMFVDGILEDMVRNKFLGKFAALKELFAVIYSWDFFIRFPQLLSLENVVFKFLGLHSWSMFAPECVPNLQSLSIYCPKSIAQDMYAQCSRFRQEILCVSPTLEMVYTEEQALRLFTCEQDSTEFFDNHKLGHALPQPLTSFHDTLPPLEDEEGMIEVD